MTRREWLAGMVELARTTEMKLSDLEICQLIDQMIELSRPVHSKWGVLPAFTKGDSYVSVFQRKVSHNDKFLIVPVQFNRAKMIRLANDDDAPHSLYGYVKKRLDKIELEIGRQEAALAFRVRESHDSHPQGVSDDSS